MAHRNKYEADARGWRAAHAAFWMDGRLLDDCADALVKASETSGDPHYMFNELRANKQVNALSQWRSGRAFDLEYFSCLVAQSNSF